MIAMKVWCNISFSFFFSSRRRHTRCSRDWSSDVCSSDLGLQILEGLLVEFAPFLGRDIRIDSNRVIEDDVSGTQSGFEIRPFGKPIPRNESRQFVIVSDAEKLLEEFFAIIEEPILMRVKMRGTDSHGISAVNLGAQLQFSFLRIDPGSGSPIVMEVAILVNETGDFVF